MTFFSIKNFKTGSAIFEGDFNSFQNCLEDAVSKKIDLSFADFRHQNLSNFNLDNSHMPYANFSGANLTGTNLSESTLNNALFFNTTLFNTCLSYSDIRQCDFRGALFGATYIEGCNMYACVFSTLSCFDLDFYLTQTMKGSLFVTPDNCAHDMSSPPLVMKGFLNTPIIVLDDTIKIGSDTFSKALLPGVMLMLNNHSKRKMGQHDNISMIAQ